MQKIEARRETSEVAHTLPVKGIKKQEEKKTLKGSLQTFFITSF